jgi:hypothetical protein
MKFMTIVKSAEAHAAPPAALMNAIARMGEEAAKSGVMVQMGGLLPTAMGARVRLSQGRMTVTDGPFTEAKEVFGGFAVYSVPSRADAIRLSEEFLELHRQHWPGWEGEVEIRQLFDPADMGPPPGAPR